MKKKETTGGEVKEGNGITELVFIIDESGSMSGFEADTVGGFNSMIEKQREEEGEAFVSAVLFNQKSRVLYDRVPLSEVGRMQKEDYLPRGCTALYDALGSAIHHIKGVHRYIRREDIPEHTIFVITTDGMENASSRYSRKEVKEMIERMREERGWEFIFVAANIDVESAAEDIGIDRSHAARYMQSDVGIQACYEAMSAYVSRSRRREKTEEDAWKAELE